MGEVYRARDTKLNRDVAIKVLPDSSRTTPNGWRASRAKPRRSASLNHPHIAHDLRAGGIRRGACPRDGACRRRRPVAADRARPDPARRGAADRAADRRGARSGARATASFIAISNPPISRSGPTAPSRCWTSGWPRPLTRDITASSASVLANSPTVASPAKTHARDDSWHRSLHVARAGAGQSRRQARRHLGVRLRALRDAHGTTAFDGEDVTDTIVAVVSQEPDWSAAAAEFAGSGDADATPMPREGSAAPPA